MLKKLKKLITAIEMFIANDKVTLEDDEYARRSREKKPLDDITSYLSKSKFPVSEYRHSSL
jgi:hypothetical protein